MTSGIRFVPSLILFVVLLICGFVGSLIERATTRTGPICTAQLPSFEGFDETQVSIALQLNEHLISAAYLIAGGAGFLVFKFIEKKISLSAVVGGFIALSFSLIFYSLYWGQVFQVRVLEMLSGHCVLLTSPALQLPSLLQYYCLFLATVAVAFALFFSLPDFEKAPSK